MEASQSNVSRPIHYFTVPPKIAAASGVSKVGMVALTADEELGCFKRAKQDNAKLAAELSKTSLVEADGKKLSLGDGTIDTFWKNLDPKLRTLVMSAYAQIHSAEDDEQESFLASGTVKVG